MKPQNFNKTLPLCVGVLVLSVIIGYTILAWTEPTLSPPDGNVAAPINTGDTSQTKSGDLNIGGGLKYWLTKLGDSFALKNDSDVVKFVIGQDGNVGIGTTNPSQNLDVAGYVKGQTGVCIGSDCRASWPGVSASSCPDPANQWVVGIDSNGKVICQGGTGGPPIVPSTPCDNSTKLSDLDANGKHIFVTSEPYNGVKFPSGEASADTLCKDLANKQGWRGDYKAVVYMGKRNPLDAFPGGKTFWNVRISNGQCYWSKVTESKTSFYTLKAPIRYNEQGLDSGGVEVWTNFKPVSGSFTLLMTSDICPSCIWSVNLYSTPECLSTGSCPIRWENACWLNEIGWRSTMSWANVALTLYGVSDAKDTSWAFAACSRYSATCSGGKYTSSDCLNNVYRYLYCVEQ